MIALLEKAIAEINKLPESQQESFAQWILDELADEARWDRAFAESQEQLAELGKRALADYVATFLEPDSLILPQKSE